MNCCLQKQAHGQKVASSSPKASWENVIREGGGGSLTNDAEEPFSSMVDHK